MFSWVHLGLVFAGGALGTALRAGLMLVCGDALGPWLVPAIDVAGAAALGVLAGVLSRRPAGERARVVQQFLGTGVLGGFTTYSALAVASAEPSVLALGAATVVVGTAAAGAGYVLGRGRSRG